MKGQFKQLAKFVIFTALILQMMTACSRKPAELKTAMIHPIDIQPEVKDESVSSYDKMTFVTLKREDGSVELSLQDYLIGVLHGELPGSFSLESMKAQAVAARTVAIKKMKTCTELCDNPNCCQAYIEPEMINKNVLAAVQQTDGEVLVYEEELIEATYFSCSGGMTEAAADVWGNEVAYLQAVASPGEEDAPRFEETVTIPFKVFLQTLQEVEPQTLGTAEIGEIVLTAGGGVKTIEIGGIVFSGIQMRNAFSLRSTVFEITRSEHTVSFHCLGYGHRVGMSQYGAQAMAEDGASYREILSYYYQGADIKKQS